MSLNVRKSDFFLADFEIQFCWYEERAGWEAARRYLLGVDRTLQRLAEHPGLGRVRHFDHPELQGLRSCIVVRPFQRHVVFYRHDNAALDAVRIMHGARDLATRLRQPPGGEDASPTAHIRS